MDLQRNILIVAFIVVSYLLFVTWQNDYSNNVAVQAPAASPVSAAVTTPSTANPAATAPSAAGDLAGLAPAGNAAPTVTPDTATAPSSKRVSVRTDVFDLQIDLAGGDIVDLKLPKYPATQKTPETPVNLLSSGTTTYIAQSGLVSAQGPDLPSGQRANYVSDKFNYELPEGSETLDVVLRSTQTNGVTVEKIFRFKRADYLVSVSYRVRNDSPETWSGFLFGQLKRDGSGDPSNPGGGSMLSASPSGLGPVYSSPEAVYNKITFEDAVESPVKHAMQGGWIGFIQHYFVSAWVPAQNIENSFFTRRTGDGFYLFASRHRRCNWRRAPNRKSPHPFMPGRRSRTASRKFPRGWT